MYNQIMVTLDGSKFAEAALPLAITLSRRTGAALHLVTVVEPVPAFAYEEWASAAEEWTREYLAKLTEDVSNRTNGKVTSSILSGHAVDMLQKEASGQQVDLVVMASHGRGAISRLWLGSVADRFVRQADRPVLLVRPDEKETPDLEDETAFDNLLVPLDGSELAESALAHATEFGELFGSAYHLTRVVAYPVDLASPYLPHTAQMNQEVLEEAKERAAEHLEMQAERMRRRGLRVTTSVTVDAQAGHGILLEAEAVDSDAIAMATHGRKGLSRALLGSTADKVLRGTHLPLLLHRPVGQQKS
ncbi:MAG: universal stress protein [Gemmatimonadota bacterium]|nr:universal stress protein [Gemmatimonadota bacterium]